MSHAYTPTPSVLTTITLPDDLDANSAASNNLPDEELADGLAFETAQRVITDAFAATLAPGLRLSVVTGTPVPSTDASSTTLYYTPYLHGMVGIYDGTIWHPRQTSEISLD